MCFFESSRCLFYNAWCRVSTEICWTIWHQEFTFCLKERHFSTDKIDLLCSCSPFLLQFSQFALHMRIHADCVLTVVKFSGPQSLPRYLQSSNMSSMLWLVLCTNSNMLKVLLGKNLLLSVGCPTAAMNSSKSPCSTPRSPAIQKMSFRRIWDFRKLL